MSGNGGGIRGEDAVLRLRFSKMISVDLARLSFRLFLWAQLRTDYAKLDHVVIAAAIRQWRR